MPLLRLLEYGGAVESDNIIFERLIGRIRALIGRPRAKNEQFSSFGRMADSVNMKAAAPLGDHPHRMIWVLPRRMLPFRFVNFMPDQCQGIGQPV